MTKQNPTREPEGLLSYNIYQSYADFSEFLLKRKGKRNFVAPAYRFLEFFKECDLQWGKIPSYEIITYTFDDHFVQKNMPVLGWLLKTHQICVDDTTEQIIISQAAIQEMFVAFDDDSPSILQEYLCFLNKRQKRRQSKPSSVRTVFQPMISLYYYYGLHGSQTPSQAQIDRYLTTNKGQISAMVCFVQYLNNHRQFNLVCKRMSKQVPVRPTYKIVGDKDRQKFERRFIALAMLTDPLNNKEKIQWINYGIRYFHRFFISIKALSDVDIKPCDEYENLMLVQYDNKQFALPKF